MKTTLRTLFILLIMTALLAACAPAAQSPATAEATPPQQTTQPTASANASEPIVLQDALGRTITLEQPPSRIAIVGRINLMFVDEAYLFPEAKEKVVSIAKSGQGNDFLYLLDPNADEKLNLEGDAGAEQIAAVNPDLIILKDSLRKKLGNALEGLGVPVMYLNSETPEAFYEDVERFGIIFQNEARAQDIIAYYQARINRIEDATQDLSDADKPSVLFLQYSTKGGEISFKVPPLGWMQSGMLQRAGGTLAWKDAELGSRWTVVGLEQIAAWDPDQIFIVDYFGDTNEAIRNLQENPLTQNLKAVQNNQVFAVPEDYYAWDQPDPRWLLCQIWMATKVHPELFPDTDVESEVYDFYQTLYGLDDATISDNILPFFALTPMP